MSELMDSVEGLTFSPCSSTIVCLLWLHLPLLFIYSPFFSNVFFPAHWPTMCVVLFALVFLLDTALILNMQLTSFIVCYSHTERSSWPSPGSISIRFDNFSPPVCLSRQLLQSSNLSSSNGSTEDLFRDSIDSCDPDINEKVWMCVSFDWYQQTFI